LQLDHARCHYHQKSGSEREQSRAHRLRGVLPVLDRVEDAQMEILGYPLVTLRQ
jgi:hypothetical protein